MQPLNKSLNIQEQNTFEIFKPKKNMNKIKNNNIHLMEKTIDALSERLYEVSEKLGHANRKIQSLEAARENKRVLPLEESEPDILTDSPDAIEMHLSFLIRRYLHNKTKSKTEAGAVVRQLERLLLHPDCIGYATDRCSYKKMLIQWRAMAL